MLHHIEKYETVFGLLALFPVLMLPVLLGGLEAEAVWKMVLVLFVTLFCSLSLGIMCSAFCTSGGTAAGLTLACIVLMALGAPLVAVVLDEALELPLVMQEGILMAFSPVSAFSMTINSIPVSQASNFWISLGWTTGIGLAALLTAFFWTPHCWQDRASMKFFQIFLFVQKTLWGRNHDTDQCRLFRNTALETNPIYWLSARKQRATLAWVVLICWALIWGLAESAYTRWPDPEISLVISWLLVASMKYFFTSEVCGRFTEDRRQDALELLLSTPLTLSDFVHGQLRALARTFLWPTMMTLAAVFLMMLSAEVFSLALMKTKEEFLFLLAIGLTIWVIDLPALFWVGLHLSLTMKNPGRSVGGTVFRILVLPWVVWFFLITLVGFSGAFGIVGKLNQYTIPVSWLVVCLVNNSIWALHAKFTVKGRFRELAAIPLGVSTSTPAP